MRERFKHAQLPPPKQILTPIFWCAGTMLQSNGNMQAFISKVYLVVPLPKVTANNLRFFSCFSLQCPFTNCERVLHVPLRMEQATT